MFATNKVDTQNGVVVEITVRSVIQLILSNLFVVLIEGLCLYYLYQFATTVYVRALNQSNIAVSLSSQKMILCHSKEDLMPHKTSKILTGSICLHNKTCSGK